MSITNGRKKSLWQKVDFALFLFHIWTWPIKGLPLNRNEIWNYQEIKMLNVELLRGWDWVPLCRSLHGQLVEFFCWNLECFCPPLKRSLFVDGDIFNPRQIDATSFANSCKITFFADFFEISNWSVDLLCPKHKTEDFNIVLPNILSKGSSGIKYYSRNSPLETQLDLLWRIINRKAGCVPSGRYSLRWEKCHSCPSSPPLLFLVLRGR